MSFATSSLLAGVVRRSFGRRPCARCLTTLRERISLAKSSVEEHAVVLPLSTPKARPRDRRAQRTRKDERVARPRDAKARTINKDEEVTLSGKGKPRRTKKVEVLAHPGNGKAREIKKDEEVPLSGDENLQSTKKADGPTQPDNEEARVTKKDEGVTPPGDKKARGTRRRGGAAPTHRAARARSDGRKHVGQRSNTGKASAVAALAAVRDMSATSERIAAKRRSAHHPLEPRSTETSAQIISETANTPETVIEEKGGGMVEGAATDEAQLPVASDVSDIIDIPGPEEVSVPRLAHGLDRVLFNPGIYYLQDPRSHVYNFDPYLQEILPVEDFNFEALTEYITSSRDSTLDELARKHELRIVGSTSSMTSVLAQFHYFISQWRPVNTDRLSGVFQNKTKAFTTAQRAPASIYLRHNDGIYAIDADKSMNDGETVLSFLGRSMEKMLTLSPQQFARFKKSNCADMPTDKSPEAYHYSKIGSILMRSQLDCQDPRLPGTGTFDLKTRAVLPIRMDAKNARENAGYQILYSTGELESFEREYYDLIRAAFLKYSMQVRIGKMDGIFVAYHNTEKIFGFQYISLDEMDHCVHGSTESNIASREFVMSLKQLDKVLTRAIDRFPGQSMALSFETTKGQSPELRVIIEPLSEEEIKSRQQGDLLKTLRAAQEVAKANKKLKKEKAEREKAEKTKTEVDVAGAAAAMARMMSMPTVGSGDASKQTGAPTLERMSTTLENMMREARAVVSEAASEATTGSVLSTPSSSSTSPSITSPTPPSENVTAEAESSTTLAPSTDSVEELKAYEALAEVMAEPIESVTPDAAQERHGNVAKKLIDSAPEDAAQTFDASATEEFAGNDGAAAAAEEAAARESTVKEQDEPGQTSTPRSPPPPPRLMLTLTGHNIINGKPVSGTPQIRKTDTWHFQGRIVESTHAGTIDKLVTHVRQRQAAAWTDIYEDDERRPQTFKRDLLRISRRGRIAVNKQKKEDRPRVLFHSLSARDLEAEYIKNFK